MAREKLEKNRITNLETLLQKSAFRHGTSAFRYGLIPQAPSDHLPISALVQSSHLSVFNLMSWNLLADAHLYNNFMNVSGSSLLKQSILELGKPNLYCSVNQDHLYHFFSELGQFIYRHKTSQHLLITEQLLRKFISLESQPSKLTRSRTAAAAAEKEILAQMSREQIVSLFLDHAHPYALDFQLAIKHSLEFIHHIQGEGGVLQWKNRFQHVENNIDLQLRMRQMDFICLQECTDSNDFLKLMNGSAARYQAITFKVDPAVNDFAVIMFDAQKYVLEDHVDYAIEGKKPAIFGRFYPVAKPEEAFIIASIHYPGGQHDLMSTILEQNKRLYKADEKCLDYFILGDYNHTADFFDNCPEEATLFFPQTGTMAGADYGNTNQAIDGLCTNLDKSSVHHIETINLLPVACPVSADMEVQFVIMPDAGLTYEPSPRFFQQPVQRTVDPLVAQVASQLLGSSDPKLTAPVPLFPSKGDS